MVAKLADYLSKVRLNILGQMLQARITSVLSMVLDVNLKQVRRLIFEMWYNDPCWDDRRVPNFIYELSTYNRQTRENRLKSPRRLGWTATPGDQALLLEGLGQLQELAEKARLTGTTLWFDCQDQAEGRLKTIVATGQFTVCMNLLEYVISIERKGLIFSAAETSRLQAVRAQLERDLARFKDQP